MTALAYNVALALGLAASAAGAALLWGPGQALLLAGSEVLVLTLIGAALAPRRR